MLSFSCPLILTQATATALEETYQAAVAAGANPRIMLINSPSNPTGRAYSPSTVSEIIKFCSRRDIVLISDEIYSELFFCQWNPQLSPFKQSEGKACVIMTGGLSKVSYILEKKPTNASAEAFFERHTQWGVGGWVTESSPILK